MKGKMKQIVEFFKRLWRKLFGYPLPHPRESRNWCDNTANWVGDVSAKPSIADVIGVWLTKWAVPQRYWHYWAAEIPIEVWTPTNPLGWESWYNSTAAGIAFDASIYIKPEWISPGVIAHEAAHTVYKALSPLLTHEFISEFEAARKDGGLLAQLFNTNVGNMYNTLEIHAEVYRFLGQEMPKRLIKYYPTLLEEV